MSLLAGIDHVAVLTSDLEAFCAFYEDVLDAQVESRMEGDGLRMVVLRIAPQSELNVFQVDGNTESTRQVPMFGRGRLDHFAFRAASLEAFDQIRDRLIERGSTDGFVTDFGHVLSVFFRDPEGLEAEVCVTNPDAVPGVANPPGTPSRRYHPE